MGLCVGYRTFLRFSVKVAQIRFAWQSLQGIRAVSSRTPRNSDQTG